MRWREVFVLIIYLFLSSVCVASNQETIDLRPVQKKIDPKIWISRITRAIIRTPVLVLELKKDPKVHAYVMAWKPTSSLRQHCGLLQRAKFKSTFQSLDKKQEICFSNSQWKDNVQQNWAWRSTNRNRDVLYIMSYAGNLKSYQKAQDALSTLAKRISKP